MSGSLPSMDQRPAKVARIEAACRGSPMYLSTTPSSASTWKMVQNDNFFENQIGFFSLFANVIFQHIWSKFSKRKTKLKRCDSESSNLLRLFRVGDLQPNPRRFDRIRQFHSLPRFPFSNSKKFYFSKEQKAGIMKKYKTCVNGVGFPQYCEKSSSLPLSEW